MRQKPTIDPTLAPEPFRISAIEDDKIRSGSARINSAIRRSVGFSEGRMPCKIDQQRTLGPVFLNFAHLL